MNEHDEYLRRRTDREPIDGPEIALAVAFVLLGLAFLVAIAFGFMKALPNG